jgi:hypothetical protein
MLRIYCSEECRFASPKVIGYTELDVTLSHAETRVRVQLWSVMCAVGLTHRSPLFSV